MIHYEKYTYKGVGIVNEDALISNPLTSIYGVLDGVSSVVPYLNNENKTGGYIAANLVKTYLESLSTIKGLKEEIEKANLLLRDKMLQGNINLSKKDELWGTALAVVQLVDEGINYIQTGDCMILAVYEDGEVRPLTRRLVSHMETRAFKKWQEAINKGINTREELYQEVVDILQSNRYQANTEKGYGVLNGELEAVDFLEYGKINHTCLKHLIMLTDGLFLPENCVPNTIPYWTYVAQTILKKGLQQYTHDLIEIEEQDPNCIQHIRFKKSDDKAGMILNL